MNGCNGRASQLRRYGSQPVAAGRRTGLAPRRQRAITHGSPSRHGLSRAHDECGAPLSQPGRARAGWVPTTTASTFSCGRGCSCWAVAALSGCRPPCCALSRSIERLRPLRLIVGLGAHLWGLPVKARVAIAAAIVASVGATIVQTLLLRRRLRRELSPGPHRYAFALWLKPALPFWLMVACDLTLEIADVLMISSYLGPAEVGMYFAAAKTMSLVLTIHYAVASALAHRIATLDGRGEEEDLRAAVADAANWSFWPSLAAGAAIGLSARPCSGSSIVSGAPTLWSPRLAWAAPPRRRALPTLPLRPAIARSPDGGSTFRRQSGTTSTVRGGLLVSPEPGGGGRIARACQDRPARPAWSRRRPTIGGRRPRVRARGGCVPA